MARLTAQQIAQMTPQFEQLLASQGIGVSGFAEDGSPQYERIDGSGRVSPGQIDELRSGTELRNMQLQSLRDQGIIDTSFFGNTMSPYLQQKYGNTGVTNADQYMQYLYGGGDRVGDYWVLPEGMSADQTLNPQFVDDSPSTKDFGLVKNGILAAMLLGLGGAAAGAMGGSGGAGAAGAAAGAAEAAPAFIGGASGAGIAGAAGGGGALAGLSAAELAALGTAGAGAASAIGSGAATGLSQAELAAMIESGTSGVAGAGLETAGLAGQGLTAAQYAALQQGGNLAGLGEYLNSVIPGMNGGTMPPGSGSALSRILSGSGGASDWTQLLGSLGAAGLGAAGANAQGDAYSDVADKYLALGAPYRDKLLETYQPGYSIANSPDFMNALDVGAQAAARATSAKSGNPVDNPGAYAEMQKYISGSLALPQLNTTRSQLGTFGQLGTNIAGANDTQAAGQTGGMYNALGYGLGQLTQPQSPFSSNGGALSRLLLNSSQYL